MNKKILMTIILTCFSFLGIDFYRTHDQSKQKPSLSIKEVIHHESVGATSEFRETSAELEEFVHKLRRLQTPEQIEAEITRLSQEFSTKDLVDKLNSQSASEEERQLFSVYLKTKLEAYQLLMDMELSDLEARYL